MTTEVAAAANLGNPYFAIVSWHPTEYELLLDQQTVTAILGGGVKWAPNYKAYGFDHTIWPGESLPFKRIGLNADGTNNMVVASKYFAMAHKCGHVEGPPMAVVRIQMTEAASMQAQWEKTVIVEPGQSSVKFLKDVTKDNYPGLLHVPTMHDITNGEAVLSLGRAMLGFI